MLEGIFNKIDLPCFIYDLQKVRGQVSKLKNSNLDNLTIFYAMKANPLPEILRVLKEQNLGVETTSRGEMERALLTGFEPEEMLVTGPGKIDSTLNYAISNGVGHIIVESVNEARRLNRLAKDYKTKQPILVRVSPTNAVRGEDLKEGFALFGGKPVKYGIDEENLEEKLLEIMNLSNLNFEGFHVFAASGISDHRLLISHVDEIFNLIKNLEKYFPKLKVIDFGGGFGYSHDDTYEFDINSYFSSLNDLTQNYNFGEKKLFLELGTYIAASCGTYLTEIVDVKKSRGENFLIVNGGIHHLLRPSLVSNHSVQIYDSSGELIHESEDSEVNIVGNLCHPLDTLSRDVKIPLGIEKLENLIGGKVAIFNCGAYGANFSVGNFGLNPESKIYYLDDKGNLGLSNSDSIINGGRYK